MGVHGLWQLLSSTGKPVSLDSLEGKVLAVDVSVWLHQLSKGMRDSDGNPLPHAHLHGLFTRICKLLYYRIKPVFVFDGGVPILKKQTLAGRREKRDDAEKESSRLQQKLLTNLIRSQAVKEALGLDKAPKLPTVPKKSSRDAVFELAPLSEASERYLVENKDVDESYEERRELQQLVEDEYEDLNAIDVDSEEFRSLPADIQHEIIVDMKERRKIYKMSRKVELPEDSKDFSQFQVTKLLKHSKLTVRLQDLRKDLNCKTAEISKHLGDNLYGKEVVSQRVLSEDASHSILIKGLRDKKQKENEDKKFKNIASEFAAISEESSNSDELMQDSGSEDRTGMDFQQPGELAVIGKAIIGQARSGNKGIAGEDIHSGFSEERFSNQNINRNNSGVASVSGSSKPVYRPVIEIDTDSDSSDEDSDYTQEPVQSASDKMKLIPKTVNETIDDEVIVIDDSDLMDDVQANRDLQLAIEKSIQDQINLVAHGPAKTEAEKEAKPVQDPLKVKNIFSKQISNLSVLSDDGSKSDEQSALDIGQGLDNKKKIKGKSKSIFEKQISNISDFSSGSDLGMAPIIEEDMPKAKENGVSLKRSASEIVDEKVETKRPRKDNSQAKADENFKNGEAATLSSDSEDEFLEVKFDPTSIKEDDLFPASMFEPGLETSNQGDENGVAMETKDSESASHVLLDSSKDKNESADVIMMDDDSSEISKRPNDHEQTSREKTEELQDIGSGTVGKHEKLDSAELANEVNVEKRTRLVNDTENHSDEVFAGVLEGNKTEDKPDVIETRRSGSSVSSLPDVIESTDESVTQESILSPERVVPDLVKDYQNLDFQTLKGMRDNLAAESQALQQERGRQERLATSINDQMHAEAQELLRLFGVPYIVSPTEAEAQCAQLDILKLTQGTITDDSDIWLFGGTNVYRNFFNQQKHVEFYRKGNIESQLGLTREKLINLALLCGSDYTEGIQGVGPVTAMEILVEFPGDGLEGLLALKAWWEAAQKQYVKPKESKLKTKIRELDLSPGFPSMQVLEAYMSPTVDDSAETFTWGSPDIEGLKHYIGIKLGWSSEKVDEHLQPVLKRLGDKQSQRRISSFFQPENYIEPAKMKSKRLQKVVNKFLNPTEITEDVEAENASGKEAKPARGGRKGQSKNKDEIGDEEIVTKDADEIKEEETDKKDSGSKSARGRGRGRGSGQGQRGKGQLGQGPCSRKRSKVSEAKLSRKSDSSSNSESDSDYDLKSINSEDEIDVVQSGINVAEILGMSGFVCDELLPGEEETMDVDKDESGSDESISDSELFKNEGGFIRENDDGTEVKPVKQPPRTEIMQDVLKQLEQAKSKYFESETSQEENVGDDDDELPVEGGSRVTDSRSVKILNGISAEEIYSNATDDAETLNLGDKGQTENIVTCSDNEDSAELESISEVSKQSDTSLPQRKVDYNKKIEQILNETQKLEKSDTFITVEDTKDGIVKCDGNSNSKLDNFYDKNVKIKTEKVELSAEEHDVSARVPCNIRDKDIKLEKDNEKGQVKMEITDSYTTEPIKTLVTGVPWASKKGKTKGGKGKARLKGRKTEPVEKIIRKSTSSVKGSKSAVGVVNLSESDSDSSD